MTSNLAEAKSVAREPYAWPGGYPRYLVMSDGGALCPACIKKEWRSIVHSALTNSNDGWRPEGSGINWEDEDLTCDHCSDKIPSAYGEPEEEPQS